ncbi:BZ3500_MvSof-1268-A1-R1_Chr7-1g09161 [Microbotryum saponariae]|uniref:BZ3500_MvSof-1268-A1-R1_Chr7-1g09161 protein n=1 Tax=Microbotryum saponariae TaxID=289078 RepID=A0A2X0KZD8_9BASI|nr:BZ3501_MvSof-1269-A2-R1_Chr7-1g08866 [Microbotryum saponariae]SDA02910.1 BZ3500_MvSof-1268-A1-R1_Chr7-1g09161 [Microbotryum saponariae]
MGGHGPCPDNPVGAQMLVVNDGLSTCFAVNPVALASNNHRFLSIKFASCRMNSTVSKIVAIPILARSVDGTNSAAHKLIKLIPWFTSALPPGVGL